MDIMKILPKCSDYKIKFKNYGFEYERALVITTLIFSCHWKTLVTFCLQKERPENAFFNTNSKLL